MDRSQNSSASALLDRRIDAMHLSATDAARAKASLRSADLIVDFGFAVAAAIRSSAAFVARHLKAAFVSSPQH